MLRRCIAILLVVALMASGFQRFFAYAGFELNRNYIAKALCENRNRPEMHCNGKCYFVKKVKAAQQRDAENERQVQKNLFQEAYVAVNAVVLFPNCLLRVVNTPYAKLNPATRMVSLFRPPKQLS